MTKAEWLVWAWQVVQFMGLMIGTGIIVASVAAIRFYWGLNERDKRRAAKAKGRGQWRW